MGKLPILLHHNMIINENQLQKILMKNKEIPRKEAYRMFLKEFNEEAGKQKSKWFAEVQNKEYKGEDYHFLHISKYVNSGWWIFKTKEKVSLHISETGGYFSFVNNDFAFSEYGEKENEEIFALLPEFKKILENIKLPFFILREYKEIDFEKRINDVTNRLSVLEGEIN